MYALSSATFRKGLVQNRDRLASTVFFFFFFLFCFVLFFCFFVFLCVCVFFFFFSCIFSVDICNIFCIMKGFNVSWLAITYRKRLY